MREHINDLDQAIKRALELGYNDEAKKLGQFRYGGKWPPSSKRPSIGPNLRLTLAHFIQQICRNVWVIEFEANLVLCRDCPNPNLNKADIL